MERRYDRVSGGALNREILYKIALHFGWTRQQWESMPWTDQRLYVEGLAFDGKLDKSVAESSEVGLDELAAAGFSVTRA